MGMDLLVPEVISLILKLGAMMVLIRGRLKRSARAVRAQCNYLGVRP